MALSTGVAARPGGPGRASVHEAEFRLLNAKPSGRCNYDLRTDSWRNILPLDQTAVKILLPFPISTVPLFAAFLPENGNRHLFDRTINPAA